MLILAFGLLLARCQNSGACERGACFTILNRKHNLCNQRSDLPETCFATTTYAESQRMFYSIWQMSEVTNRRLQGSNKKQPNSVRASSMFVSRWGESISMQLGTCCKNRPTFTYSSEGEDDVCKLSLMLSTVDTGRSPRIARTVSL